MACKAGVATRLIPHKQIEGLTENLDTVCNTFRGLQQRGDMLLRTLSNLLSATNVINPIEMRDTYQAALNDWSRDAMRMRRAYGVLIDVGEGITTFLNEKGDQLANLDRPTGASSVFNATMRDTR
jgi:hypothetical protein